MRRKRKARIKKLNLQGIRVDVVGNVIGHAKSARQKHGYGFVDDNVTDLVLEAASDLGISLSDSEIESAACRLLGRQRIDDAAWADYPWHLL